MELGSEAWRCCGEQLLCGSELPALHPYLFLGLFHRQQSWKIRKISPEYFLLWSKPRVSCPTLQRRAALPCSTTSPAPPTPPFQAQQALGFSSPSARLFPMLGQGFLKVITSSHELTARQRKNGSHALPAAARVSARSHSSLLRSLPAPARLPSALPSHP